MAALTATFTAGQSLPPHRVRAHNGSEASENKIHDDAVARQYGFAGGLVPGVTDYAYMTRPLIEALGLEWLEHGRLSARFLKPIYEGDDVTVETKVTSISASGVAFDVTAFNSAGEPCAGLAGVYRVDQPDDLEWIAGFLD